MQRLGVHQDSGVIPCLVEQIEFVCERAWRALGEHGHKIYIFLKALLSFSQLLAANSCGNASFA